LLLLIQQFCTQSGMLTVGSKKIDRADCK